jgi:pimeloyl-ACP methyl ester carboxylesterase
VLQRQLVAAGLKNVKGAVLDGCAHWIYEESPEETLAAITNFLSAANAPPRKE